MHLDELLPEGDIARVIHEVVERLDITEIVDAIKARRKKSQVRGEPAYHPRVHLKLLFYGLCTGVRSSRKLATQARWYVPMMWLAGSERPDFRTISDFRKEHRPAIARLFVQFLQLAQALGLVDLERVALDGSKFKASASKYRNVSKERLQAKVTELEEEVRRLLKEAEETDAAEDQEFGNQEGASLPEELKEKQTRLARMEKVLATLQEQQDNGERTKRTDPQKQTINPTDPDSRIMSRRNGGSIQGVNGQIAVDGKSQIIVGATMSNNPIDTPQLIPTLDAVQEATGNQPAQLLADTGYFSGENLAELEERNIEGFIADAITETKRETDPFSKDHFPYGADQDAYRCPQGHCLGFKGEYLLPDGRVQRRYSNPQACKHCPVHDECTKAKTRVISHDQHEPRRVQMRTKLKSPEGKQTYGLRKGIVEPVWGQIKQAMGYRQVSFRGLDAVAAEFQMVCAAFNLRKIATKLAAAPELWSTLRSWAPRAAKAATPGRA